MAKEDPTVFFDPVAPLVDVSLVHQTSLDDHSFKLEHTKLMELYMKEKTDCGWIEHAGYQGDLAVQHGCVRGQHNQMARFLVALAESLVATSLST